MPIQTIVITKSTSFQGRVEEFSNAYTMELTEPAEPSGYDPTIDALVDSEKTIHSSLVSFVRAQVFDVGSPPNYMRYSRALSGTGSQSAGSPLYAECAVLISWQLERRFGLFRSVDRKLRKWLHVCTPLGLDPSGRTASSPVSALQTYATVVTGPVGDLGAELCAPNGDRPIAPPEIFPYIEHRQFN